MTRLGRTLGALMLIAAVSAGCGTSIRFPAGPNTAPEAEATPTIGERLPGDVVSSGDTTLSLVSLSAVQPGRPASASFRYGTYQNCHAQVLLDGARAIALGTYVAGYGETVTWRWDEPADASSSGVLVVTCDLNRFEIPFGTPVGATPTPLRSVAVPWSTPLSCSATVKGCESSYR